MSVKIYRVRWGEITVGIFISEAPKSFLIETGSRHGRKHKDRVYKNKIWGHSRGGYVFNTEKSFLDPKMAIAAAKEQIKSFKLWISEHQNRAIKLEDDLKKAWGEPKEAE